MWEMSKEKEKEVKEGLKKDKKKMRRGRKEEWVE